MLKQLTSPQLTELEAMWAIEGGWGEYKQDYRFGQLCSLQANINRNAKTRPEPYKPDDFVMRPRQDQQVNQDMADARIRHAMEMFSGVKAGKKKGK